MNGNQVAPMSPIDAAAKVCSEFPGGNAAMAQRLGVSVHSLRHMLNPGDGSTAKLGVEQLMRICEISNDWTPLDAMELQAGRMAVPLPDPHQTGSADAFKHVTGMAGGFSGTVAAFTQAVADGKVSENELQEVQEAAMRLVREVQGMLMHSAVLHERSKPRDPSPTSTGARLREVA